MIASPFMWNNFPEEMLRDAGRVFDPEGRPHGKLEAVWEA